MHRAPNPPEVFEGRAEERAWLAARLRANPLAIVWGPPGLGKTGLALQVARDLDIVDAIFGSALDTPDGATFLIGLGRRLAGPAGDDGAPSLRGGLETDLLMMTIELAERARATVILDDLHALPDGLVERLLLAVSRYARSSRWVALTRARPHHEELADKTLRLDPLSEEALVGVVRRCAPARSHAEAVRLARLALGSPYRARRLVLSEGRAPGGSVLADLSPAARRAIDGLRILAVPVDLAAAVERELDERGLIRLESGGARLDDRLRPLVDAEPLDVDEARRIALALLHDDDAPKARFEALRLAIARGDLGLVDVILRARRADLFALGYASPIFDLLKPTADRALRVHLFACADWILGGVSLTWAMAEEPPEDPAERFVFCKLLAHGGALARAMEETRELIAHGPPELRVDASILLADLHRHAADPAEAIALLETLVATTERERVDRDLRLANALALGGDLARASALLASLPAEVAGLGVEARRRLRLTLGSALLAAGRFRDLERLLGDGDPPADAQGSELFAYLALAVERGRLDLGRRLLARVHAYIDDSVGMRFVHGYNTVRLRLAAGPLPGLAEIARARALDARALEYPELIVWSTCAKASVDLLLHPLAHLDELPAGMLVPPGTTRWLLDAWRAILAARRGEVQPALAPPDLPMDIALVVLRAEAEAAIAQGLPDLAEEALTRAIDLARRHGLVLEEANLLAVLVDARLIFADPATSGRALIEFAANDLRLLGAQLGSERFAAEARLGAWLAGSERDATTLLDLAECAASPVARRRAMALLGRAATLDALDARVVATAEPAAREGGLILDLARRALRLPSGKIVDLSTAELHVRLLEVLIKGGGRATKEALVRGAWELAAYHPHRDDKRLQVAVHRLRHLVEASPREPTVLLRHEDGYRLGAPVRLGRVGPNGA